MSALLDSGSPTWDHGLEDIAGNVNAMGALTSGFIEKNWKNVEFVQFCFSNALQMSYTWQASMNKIKADEDKFWELMHPSDLAYAITGFVNNEGKWRDKWERDKDRKKAGEVIQAKGKAKRSGARGKKGGARGGGCKKKESMTTKTTGRGTRWGGMDKW